MKKELAKKMSEEELFIENLLFILEPIYTKGLPIDEFKRTLLYLSSLEMSSKKNKNKIMNSWVFPYIESLFVFFDRLQRNEELKKENRYFIEDLN